MVKDPSRFLPQARLKFVRFGGTEMGLGQDFNVIKSIEFNKALPRVITESREFIKTQLRDFQTLQDDGILLRFQNIQNLLGLKVLLMQ